MSIHTYCIYGERMCVVMHAVLCYFLSHCAKRKALILVFRSSLVSSIKNLPLGSWPLQGLQRMEDCNLRFPTVGKTSRRTAEGDGFLFCSHPLLGPVLSLQVTLKWENTLTTHVPKEGGTKREHTMKFFEHIENMIPYWRNLYINGINM